MHCIGTIKSSILLRNVWLNQRVPTTKILQQGTTLKSRTFDPLLPFFTSLS